MGEGSKDGVLEFRSADARHIAFRLGVQFRDPGKPRPDSLLPARYVRVSVASPPPRRIDGTTWAEGLVTAAGTPFDPANPPTDGQVFPINGIAPLRQPDPETIVFDQWLAAPEAPAREPNPIFNFGPTVAPLSFLSVSYPDPRPDGTPLTQATVAYYDENVDIQLDREVNIPVDGVWIAISVDRFFPPERASADYIVRCASASSTMTSSPLA